MISPLEIQEKEFSRGLKGFKEDEVNEFLDRITLDLEHLLEENRQLKAEKQQMEEELKKYQSSEGAVLQTLETAKALMGDLSASAEKRAQILLKNAEMEAQRMQREAKENIDRMQEENAALRNRFTSFQKRYKQLLQEELHRFDNAAADLFPELEVSDLSDLPDAAPKKKRASRSGKPNIDPDDRKKTMVHIK
ncbi:DivIVA domain-containing protein [Anaerovorax odorimutans]|uniref:DivIVA domain-containing protein n=1 Tax=Anaerovorax odorimutans TaxID=109327 RepID=A0ABT1RRV8_9FIRM|nr:DivIVA domain-containing protein [Anaerovorax odorimutans]MCQ4637900.1 DivIVA domain-containing protein [Anaerovorax odorimutans]